MTDSPLSAEDVFRRHGLGPFVAALVQQGAISAGEAAALRSRDLPGDEGAALARELGRRLVESLGGDAKAWYKYEISEIGYNFDVTSYGYGSAAEAGQWEVLNEQDNTFVYVTRLSTMEALAAGLLGSDPPGTQFATLIARLHAHRARDADLKARMRAGWAARHPR